MELTTPWVSYFVGLCQTDGHLSEAPRNRGRLSIELAKRDEDVLLRLAALIPYRTYMDERSRSTNFAPLYSSSILNAHERELRVSLQEWGVPVGRKSSDVAPPRLPYSELDYVRGLIDGDGSLGITAQGIPFLSLNTSSDALAQYFIGFVHRITGKPTKQNQRNARDGSYNIVVFREDAVSIARVLYYSGCICLERKRAQAEIVKAWIRPPRAPKVWRRWTAEDDGIAVRMPAAEAARLLGRTIASVYARRVDRRRTRPPRPRSEHNSREWRQWTPDEDRFVLTHSVADSVTHLRRDKMSIYTRLSRLRRTGRARLPLDDDKLPKLGDAP